MAGGKPPPQRRFQKPAIFLCDMQERFQSSIREFDKIVLTTRKLLRAAQFLRIPVFVTTQNRTGLGNTVPELRGLLAGLGDLVRVDADKTGFSMWSGAEAVRTHPHFTSDTATAAAAAAAAAAAEAEATTTTTTTTTGVTSPSEVAPLPSQIALVGIESHICVTQTALDLARAGHHVYVLADGVSSCNREEVPVALDRLRTATGSGATLPPPSPSSSEGRGSGGGGGGGGGAGTGTGSITVTTSESWLYECMGDAAIPQFRQVLGVVKDTAKDTRDALQGLLAARM